MKKHKLPLTLIVTVILILIAIISIAAANQAGLADETGILLYANLPAGRTNEMKLMQPLMYGWFLEDYNPSTGYSWRFIQDNSGVYRLVGRVILHGSTGMVGVPGKIIWQFQALKKGTGKASFALFPPGKKEAEKIDVVTIKVQ